MITVVCSQCGLRILVPPSVQGRSGICFGCGAPLHVPTSADIERHRDLAFSPGDLIAERYVIEETLGAGGMGVVYRAQDRLIGETVALKFLHPTLLKTIPGKRLFLQEAQIARRLRHENIVAVHDVSWTVEGILFLSMEYLEGQSLRAMLRKQRDERRFIDVRFVVHIVQQVLRALEYAHRYVIHRDIKPENIMLLRGEQVKVLDFGLAKAIQEELVSQHAEYLEQQQTRPIGTLVYAAPEQRRQQPVDLRADIYALGKVFYELLTLRTPYEEQIPVQQARKDVSPSLLHVLDRAVAEEKEVRFRSATEFRIALESAYRESYQKVIQAPLIVQNRTVSTEGMVFLEGGRFLMGSNEFPEEAPEHEEEVGPFWIDKYPVTVAEYEEYLKATGAPEPRFWRDPRFNGPNQPVVGVSFQEALAYAEWKGKTLPTEAQWEFAARGKENRRYPWGNLPPDPTLSNFNEYLGMPSIVTMHEDGRTPEGVYDLAGNVYEWTLDPFVSYLVRMHDPAAAQRAPRRAVRGGCWNSSAQQLRCSARVGLFPESRLETVGFRCVLPAGDRTQ